MKIAVFYENIYEGVQAAGLDMEAALSRLRDAGMEMLYISADSWKRDRNDLKRWMENLGLQMEGMYGFCDFPGRPDSSSYREMLDLALESGAQISLSCPECCLPGTA